MLLFHLADHAFNKGNLLLVQAIFLLYTASFVNNPTGSGIGGLLASERLALNNPARSVGQYPQMAICVSKRRAFSLHIIFPFVFRFITMSYIQTFYHIVFRTYQSEQTITLDHDRELYAVIMEQTTNLGGKIFRIGGMPDHVHIFVSLPSTLSIAQYVQAVKAFTSKWMKANPKFPYFRGWGHEYAAFTYSIRDKEMIVNYIRNQKEHHKRTTFADEYRTLLREWGVDIKEEYFLKD